MADIAQEFVDKVKASQANVGESFIDVIMQIITAIMGFCKPAGGGATQASRVAAFVRLAKQPILGIFARARLRSTTIEVLTRNGMFGTNPTPYVKAVLDAGDSPEDKIQAFLDEKTKTEFDWGE